MNQEANRDDVEKEMLALQAQLSPEERALYRDAVRSACALVDALKRTVPKPGKGTPSMTLSALHRALENATDAIRSATLAVCTERLNRQRGKGG